jgi:SAM-dependent methyltransferase
MTDEDLPDHVRRNRAAWDIYATGYAEPGHRAWAAEPSWGIWGVPESEIGLLPADMTGLDAIELGCGTAYISAWLARRGAHVVGIDNSERQLDTARALQGEFGLEFPLIHGNAETVPLPDASFDFAISEYGASIWADPYRWIPEASRLLRPGGELVFLVNGTILILTIPQQDGLAATETLLRPYFGLHRTEWDGADSVDFHLGYGDWIRLLRTNGFEVEDLIELRPAEDAVSDHNDLATLEWARQWPSEEIWRARKRG